MHNPFKAKFSNSFINLRGEISDNLATSNSKAAIKIRAKKRMRLLRNKMNELKKIINMETKVVNKLRSDAMKRPVEERQEAFQLALEKLTKVQEWKKELSQTQKEFFQLKRSI